MAWGFVQEAQGSSATAGSTFGVAFTTSNVVANNRMLVGVACWNSTAPTVTSITDSAGNTWNGPLKRITLSDGTDVTVWDAVITAGGGTKPTVTAHINQASGNEIALFILEYSGLSTATTGYTDGVAGQSNSVNSTTLTTVSSGATSPVAGASSELAIGFFGDGGDSGVTLNPGSGWTQRGTSILSGSTSEGAWEDENSTSGAGSNAQWSYQQNTGGTVPVAVIAVIIKLAGAAAASPGLVSYGYSSN